MRFSGVSPERGMARYRQSRNFGVRGSGCGKVAALMRRRFFYGESAQAGDDDSDGRRMKRKLEGSMAFESGVSGMIGAVGVVGKVLPLMRQRSIYGECKIKDGSGMRDAGRIWSAARTNLMKSASPTVFGSH